MVRWGFRDGRLRDYRICITHQTRNMKLTLQIFMEREWSLGITRICHNNRFWGPEIVRNIWVLSYNVRHSPALASWEIRVIFGSSCIFERLIHIYRPLISEILVLHLMRSHHLHNVVFVDWHRPHNQRSEWWSLVVRKGNLLFSLTFKILLLFEIIAVNIAI